MTLPLPTVAASRLRRRARRHVRLRARRIGADKVSMLTVAALGVLLLFAPAMAISPAMAAVPAVHAASPHQPPG